MNSIILFSVNIITNFLECVFIMYNRPTWAVKGNFDRIIIRIATFNYPEISLARQSWKIKNPG